jgi:ribonuclease P protein component
VLWLRSGSGAALRLGVVSSKKVSNRAVDRNLARRRLRDVVRRRRAELSGPFDLVLVARRNLLAAPPAEVEREFLRLARRLGISRPAVQESAT